MSDSDVEAVLAVKFARLLPHLNEPPRRLAVAAEVAGMGRVSMVARASGLSRPTVYRGLAELDGPVLESRWVRAPGGGRKRLVQTDPGLAEASEALTGPASRGDPGSQLRWTTRSTRNLAEALTATGIRCRGCGWMSCCTSGTTACRATPRSVRVPSTRSGCPVPVHQPEGGQLSAPPRAGDQRRCEEEGVDRQLQEPETYLAAGG